MKLRFGVPKYDQRYFVGPGGLYRIGARSLVDARTTRTGQSYFRHYSAEMLTSPRPGVKPRRMTLREIAHDLTMFEEEWSDQRPGSLNVDEIHRRLKSWQRKFPALGLTSLSFAQYEQNKPILLFNLRNIAHVLSGGGTKEFLSQFCEIFGQEFVRSLFLERDFSRFVRGIMGESLKAKTLGRNFWQMMKESVDLFGLPLCRRLILDEARTFKKIILLTKPAAEQAIELFGPERAVKIIRQVDKPTLDMLCASLPLMRVSGLNALFGEEGYLDWMADQPSRAMQILDCLNEAEVGPQDLAEIIHTLTEVSPAFAEKILSLPDLSFFTEGFVGSYIYSPNNEFCNFMRSIAGSEVLRNIGEKFPYVLFNIFVVEVIRRDEEVGWFEETYPIPGYNWKEGVELEDPRRVEPIILWIINHIDLQPAEIFEAYQTIWRGRKEHGQVALDLFDLGAISLLQNDRLGFAIYNSGTLETAGHAFEALPDDLAAHLINKIRMAASQSDYPPAKFQILLQLALYSPKLMAALLPFVPEQQRAAKLTDAFLAANYFDIVGCYDGVLTQYPPFAGLLPINAKIADLKQVFLDQLNHCLTGHGVVADPKETRDRVLQNFRISRTGQILPRRPKPLAAYRGSREGDDPFAEYVTLSVPVALRYGVRGGEAAQSQGFRGIFEIDCLKQIRRESLDGDPNVALGFVIGGHIGKFTRHSELGKSLRESGISSNEDLQRVRFVRLADSGAVKGLGDHLLRLEAMQEREQQILQGIIEALKSLGASNDIISFRNNLEAIEQYLHQLSQHKLKEPIHKAKVALDYWVKMRVESWPRILTRFELYQRGKKSDMPDIFVEKSKQLLYQSLSDFEDDPILSKKEVDSPEFAARLETKEQELDEKVAQMQAELDRLLDQEIHTNGNYIPWEADYAKSIFEEANHGGESIFSILTKAESLAEEGDFSQAYDLIEGSGTFQQLLAQQAAIQAFRRWEERIFDL